MNIDHLLDVLAASPWALAVLFAAILIDGVFPPIPSETAMIGMLTTGLADTPFRLLVIFVVGSLGAAAGDVLAFYLGRQVNFTAWRIFSGRRAQRTIDVAQRTLLARPVAVIMAARYVPIGRVAVNFTAGSLGYSSSRFIVIATISGVLWSIQCLFFAALGHVWFGDHSTLAAILVSVVLAIGVGLGLDRLNRRATARADAAAAEASSSEAVSLEAEPAEETDVTADPG